MPSYEVSDARPRVSHFVKMICATATTVPTVPNSTVKIGQIQGSACPVRHARLNGEVVLIH